MTDTPIIASDENSLTKSLLNSVEKNTSTPESDGPDCTVDQKKEVHQTIHHFGFGGHDIKSIDGVNVEYTPFYAKPRIMQYWVYGENGEKTLHRSKEERKTGWSELFFDLIFVLAYHRLSETLSHEIEGLTYLIFIVCFLALWRIWIDYTIFNTRFAPYDIFSKIYFFLGIISVLFLSSIFDEHLEEVWYIKYFFVFNYLIIRWCSVLFTYHVSRYIPIVSPFVKLMTLNLLLSSIPWIITLCFEANEMLCYIFWLIGIVGDIILELMRPHLATKYKLPLCIEHIVERLGLLMIIFMGEEIGSLYFSFHHAHYYTYFCLFFALLHVFSYFIIYYEIEHSSHKQHALRTTILRGQMWFNGHVFLAMALIFIGLSLCKFIEASAGEVSQIDLYLYVCQFLYVQSIFILLMILFGLLHHNNKNVKIKKRTRMIIRFVFFLIFAILGTIATFSETRDHFSYEYVLSSSAIISFFWMIIEVYGLQPKDPLYSNYDDNEE